MKRFFKAVEKVNASSKKKATLFRSSVVDGGTNNGGYGGCGVESVDPLKFLTWNANSFLLRVKNNCSDFSDFISDFDPDVIAIQEVRIPAAGTKDARRPGELKDDTTSSREEKQILMRALSNPPFGNYHVWWSLADSKYAGTALFVKKCFEPKKVSFSLDMSGSKHEADGRVIIAEFNSLILLNTYVPNNGWKDEENSFQRRRKWDKKVLDFVLLNSHLPLLWCGDLNVSHEEMDVSHPEFFSSARLNGYVPPNKEDWGQPGYTLAERSRFQMILNDGKLVDAYRFLHKEKDMERGFSWCGNPVGRYRGKRMRIDYFLVSEQLKDRIVACYMHGQGIELQGFYGSDHCPVTLELCKEEDKQNNQLKVNRESCQNGN